MLLRLINADYAVAAVLISFGGVIGKFSAAEYLVMAFFEIIFYTINFYIGTNIYGAIDIGGSMWIHIFGAYFGLTVALIFTKGSSFAQEHNHSTYNSNLFSILGTIFLWMFWPSFNCALATGGQAQRTVINTLLSLTASCVIAFCWSGFLRKGKFDMVEIQNATLAGGVAVGCTADLAIQPFGALVIGFAAGSVSTLGFGKLMPLLEKVGLHDTAGINNLHGMPGLIGGLAGIFAALNLDDIYGDKIGIAYPFRAPSNVTLAQSLNLVPGKDRNAGTQAGFQAAAVFTTLALAIGGGIFTSLVLKAPCVCRVADDEFFLDSATWHTLPNDFPANPNNNDAEGDVQLKTLASALS